MPNFVIGVNISELQVTTNVNPFMNEAPSAEPVVPNDIFGVAPTAPVAEETNSVDNNIFNAPPVSEPAPTTVVNDVFNTPTPAPEVPQQVAPEATPTTVAQPVVEQPTPAQPVTPEPVVAPTSTEAVVTQPQAEPVAPAPTEVTATPLEGTTTITPVTDTTSATNEQSTEAVVAKKGSKGFVNLIILLGVLVGVTLISIELGKFLYNTYGV